jgi:uncharacterized radical SAM superfamily protein
LVDHVEFVNPKHTLSVSVTGTKCQLNCAHCGGRYLSHMTPIEDLASDEKASSSDITSYLISGGCSSRGVVPVIESLDSVNRIGHSAGKRVNMHTGLVASEPEAQAIGAIADVVSFDFVGSDSAIRNVYGLPLTVDDYALSFELLSKHCRVVPHVCIGLDGGLPSGELTALRLVRELGADEVVLIVLIPTPGTRFASCRPPDLQHVRKVVETARSTFADGIVKLGCMRPRGEYRSQVDRMCLDLGIDAIVLPHRDAVRHAEDRGLKVIWTEECCAL